MRMQPAMEKPFLVLDMKLDQLESRVRQLSSLPTGEDAVNGVSSCRLSDSVEEIRTQIDFLDTLLAAEMDFHSENTPHGLRRISERLDALQNAFSRWEEDSPVPPGDFLDEELSDCYHGGACFREPEFLVLAEREVAEMERQSEITTQSHRNVSEILDARQHVFRRRNGSPDPTGDFLDDDDDSLCCCGHGCFREGKVDEEEGDATEPVPEPELVVPVDTAAAEDLASEGNEDDEAEVETKTRCPRRSGGWRCFIVAPFAVGVVAVAMGLVANLHWAEEQVYLVPT